MAYYVWRAQKTIFRNIDPSTILRNWFFVFRGILIILLCKGDFPTRTLWYYNGCYVFEGLIWYCLTKGFCIYIFEIWPKDLKCLTNIRLNWKGLFSKYLWTMMMNNNAKDWLYFIFFSLVSEQTKLYQKGRYVRWDVELLFALFIVMIFIIDIMTIMSIWSYKISLSSRSWPM